MDGWMDGWIDGWMKGPTLAVSQYLRSKRALKLEKRMYINKGRRKKKQI